VALDFAQRIEEAVALFVRMRLARVFEQLLLELAERRDERMGETAGSQPEEAGEHMADPRGQILPFRQFLQRPLVRLGDAPKRGNSLRHDCLPPLRKRRGKRDPASR